jgi:hypothetical protein
MVRLIIFRSAAHPNLSILGTEYDQLAILNPDFTLNPEKLAEQVRPSCIFIFPSSTYFLLGSTVVRCFSTAVLSQQDYVYRWSVS